MLALWAAATHEVISRELASNLSLIPVAASAGLAVFALRTTLESENRGKRLPVFVPTARVIQESAAFFLGAVLAVICFALLDGG